MKGTVVPGAVYIIPVLCISCLLFEKGLDYLSRFVSISRKGEGKMLENFKQIIIGTTGSMIATILLP